MKHDRLSTVLFVSMLWMWGCAEQAPVEGRDLDDQAIYGGDLPDAWYHDATVAITTYHNPKRNIFCSGTLIAPDVVLTAAHCADEANWNASNYNEFEPGDLKVGFGDRRSSMSFMTLIDVEIHPGYDRTDVGVNDLALLRLSSDASVTPVPALPYALALQQSDVGATVNFAGFGLNNTGDPFATKLQVDGVIDAINATTVEYEQFSGGPCSGDSGGPMFFERNGDIYVAGVTSWGSSNCSGNGAFGVSMTPDVYEDWISSF